MPRIYLSPSTQEFNPYINGGNEEEYMNYLADAIEPYLISSGINFIRNSPDGTVLDSIAQSNANDIDLHVALHSNAAPESLSGQLQGTDVYYKNSSSASNRFANLVAKEFRDIYPYPNMVDTRASTALAEVLRVNAPSVLIETAYHDNLQDAQWIKDNISQMARAISKAIADYFYLPLIEPTGEKVGFVSTGGANLNLRARPNTGANIIARIPNGARVLVRGISDDGWYVIEYDGKVGYASGQYLS